MSAGKMFYTGIFLHTDFKKLEGYCPQYFWQVYASGWECA